MDLVTLRLSCSSGGRHFRLTDPEMISKPGEPYSMQRFQNGTLDDENRSQNILLAEDTNEDINTDSPFRRSK